MWWAFVQVQECHSVHVEGARQLWGVTSLNPLLYGFCESDSGQQVCMANAILLIFCFSLAASVSLEIVPHFAAQGSLEWVSCLNLPSAAIIDICRQA